MAENIDNLLVGLGLDVDQQSFQRGEASLMGLRNAGLTAGAAIAAVAGGAKVVTDMANTRSAAGFMAESLGLAADEADRLGFALEQMGGDSGNALGVLRQMRDLRNEFLRGEGALFTAGEFGIQAGPIANAQSEMQALLELSEQLQGLNESQRSLAIGNLGFEGTGISNLLRGGPTQFREQLGRAEELRQLTQEEIDTSQELIRAQNELGRAISELNDSIVMKVAPFLTDLFESTTRAVQGDMAADTSGNVTSLLDKFPESQIDRRLLYFINGVMFPDAQPSGGTSPGPAQSSVANDEEFRAAVARANREIGAPEGLLWAQMGQESSYNPRAVSPAGARGLAQIMPETERSLEERFGRDLDPFDPMDALKMQQELMRENFQNSGSWTEALRLYHGGYDRSQWGPVNEAYAPAIEGRMQNPQANMSATFNIYDARDPEMVAKVVRREVRDLSERGANSYRSRVT